MPLGHRLTPLTAPGIVTRDDRMIRPKGHNPRRPRKSVRRGNTHVRAWSRWLGGGERRRTPMKQASMPMVSVLGLLLGLPPRALLAQLVPRPIDELRRLAEQKEEELAAAQ